MKTHICLWANFQSILVQPFVSKKSQLRATEGTPSGVPILAGLVSLQKGLFQVSASILAGLVS